MKGWSQRQATKMLPVHLTGDAHDYFELLPPEVRVDLRASMRAMSARFHHRQTPASVKAQFQNARQREVESLDDFAGRLRGLAVNAFPGLPLPYVEGELVNQFMCGCMFQEAVLSSNDSYSRLDLAVEAVKRFINKQQLRGLAPKKIRTAIVDPPADKTDKGKKKSTATQAGDISQRTVAQSPEVSLPSNPEWREQKRAEVQLGHCPQCGQMHNRGQCPRIQCRLCYGRGHLARECTRVRCFRCNKYGHYARDCPN